MLPEGNVSYNSAGLCIVCIECLSFTDFISERTLNTVNRNKERKATENEALLTSWDENHHHHKTDNWSRNHVGHKGTKIAVKCGSTNTCTTAFEKETWLEFDPCVLPGDVCRCYVSVLFIRLSVSMQRFVRVFFFCLVFYFTQDDVVSQRLGFGRWNFFIGVTYGHVLF